MDGDELEIVIKETNYLKKDHCSLIKLIHTCTYNKKHLLKSRKLWAIYEGRYLNLFNFFF